MKELSGSILINVSQQSQFLTSRTFYWVNNFFGLHRERKGAIYFWGYHSITHTRLHRLHHVTYRHSPAWKRSLSVWLVISSGNYFTQTDSSWTVVSIRDRNLCVCMVQCQLVSSWLQMLLFSGHFSSFGICDRLAEASSLVKATGIFTTHSLW